MSNMNAEPKFPFNAGDIVAYRITYKDLKDSPYYNKFVLLKVMQIVDREPSKLYKSSDYKQDAVVALFEWVGDDIPRIDEINTLKFKPFAYREFWDNVDGKDVFTDEYIMYSQLRILIDDDITNKIRLVEHLFEYDYDLKEEYKVYGIAGIESMDLRLSKIMGTDL